MFKSPSFVLSLTATAVLTACSSAPNQMNEQRAILVSIDALNESIIRQHLDAGQTPALFEVFEQGACTEYTQPMFPSVTAAGHASIWTGAYGNVHHITANAAHVLPRDQNTVTATVSGFSASNLSAEPIWISAGYNGQRVGGHHATQGPGAAGFQPHSGQRSAQQQADFERVVAGYELPSVQVMNGYNKQIENHGLLTAETVEWGDVSDWRNTRSLGVTVEPKAFTFNTQAGAFYGLIYGANGYDRIAIATTPDIEQAVIAIAQPAETEPFANRPLARYFSEPLAVDTASGRTYLRTRLFEMSPDGEDFLLYHAPMHIMDTNHDEVEDAYNQYVQGWFGNSATRVYTSGGFGPTRMQGGDGTAEARYLETAELLTRVFNKGSEFFWQQQQVDLLVDYFPLGDSIDHSLLTMLDPQWPGYDADISGHLKDMRNKVWELVDIRLQHLLDLAAGADATTFVAGDHGMTSSWLEFRPNVLLQAAGLQVLDADGHIDLSRSKAVAPTGYWVTINTTDWHHGIVAPEDKDSVIAEVVTALQGARDEQGTPLIEQVFLASEHPELGLGGPAGGDVYWAERKHYRSSRTTRGSDYSAVTSPLGWHSLASTNPQMQTVTCAYGSGFAPKRVPAARLIDIAPTVSEYLNISAPPHSQGRSLLRQMRE